MKKLTVKNLINAPINKVWQFWTDAKHVQGWNFASPDWHCPNATVNLEVGGEFHFIMAAKDESASFDFWGTYQKIEEEKFLDILIGDGRKMSVSFEKSGNGTLVTEDFEPENENPIELQQEGWQMILNNFKEYCEKLSK